MAGQLHHSIRFQHGQSAGGQQQQLSGHMPPGTRPLPGHQPPQHMMHQYQPGVIVSVGQQGPSTPNMVGPPSHQSAPPMHHHMGGISVHQQHATHHHVNQGIQGGPGYQQHHRQQPQEHFRSQHPPHNVPPPGHNFHQQPNGDLSPLPSISTHQPPQISYQQPLQVSGPAIGQILDPLCPPPILSGSMLSNEKTPMCLVNELARFNKIQHQYRLTDESGPAHKKTFTVCLKIGDKEEYVASGPSIKKAQHAAANITLEKTQFKHPSPKTKNQKNTNLTPTVELNALAMRRGEQTTYTFLEPNSARATGSLAGGYNAATICFQNQSNNMVQRNSTFPPVFCVQLRVGSNDFIGEGVTAQAAKHSAANKALKILRDLPLPDGKSKLDPNSVPFVPGSEYDELKSPISLVHEVALKRNLQVQFEVSKETGPPHMRVFLTKCIVGDFATEGEGNGKKVSKKKAAEIMIEHLKLLPPIASAMVPRPRKVTNPTKKKAKNLIKNEAKDGPVAGTDGDIIINPISRLIQIQQAKKEKEPQYILVSERGMPRRREFVMKVIVGQHSGTGTGPNKKLAKRAAAEALLQVMGYSRGLDLHPDKSALKMSGDQTEKTKKLTFEDEVHRGGDAGGGGSSGRQLVPGLLYLDSDKQDTHGIIGKQQYKAAAIAAEMLSGGTSPAADLLAGSCTGNSQPDPRLSSLPSQGVQPKEQLAYLSQVLGFSVTYTDFPKKGEYLSLVSLSTNPPQVSHGAGATLEGSHNCAALTALRSLASKGLDSVNQVDQGVQAPLTNGLLENGH